MESSTIVPGTGRRAVEASTMAEAFRLTVAAYGDRVAVRTKEDEVSLTWAQLRDRVDALAGGLARLGVRKGDTVAIMLGNRPEFAIADLAVMTLGATPFSLYQTLSAEQVQYVIADAGAHVALVEEAHLAQMRGARELGLPGAGDGRGARGRRRRGHGRLGRRRGRRPGLRPRAPLARPGARRPPDAHLHVRDDRAAEGRPAHAPQPAGRRQEHRGRRQVPRGRDEGHLVAAGGPHRRAGRPPLPADRLRHDGHDLPEPARDRRLPAGRAPDVVLRGPAHLGEAARRHAGRRVPGGLGGPRASRRRHAQGGARAGRRAGAGGPRRQGGRARRAGRPGALDARSRRGGRRQRRRRARPRARCSSSSTRSGSRSRSCGGCPRRAAPARSTRPTG